MKARITHLKAPWPEGAVVGMIVLFEAGHAPAWAVGKFEQAEEDAEPELVVPAGSSVRTGELSEADRVREEAAQYIEQLRREFSEHRDQMQSRLQDLAGQNEALQTARAEAESKTAEANAAIAALQADLDKARSELAVATSKKK